MKLSRAFSTLILLAEAAKTAHAGKIDASSIIADGTLEQPGARMLKKTNCSSNCYKAATSAAFVTALTTVANYKVNKPLVLNICAGETIDVPTGGSTGGNYEISLTNPSAPASCSSYELIINCCGDNCKINYSGSVPSVIYGPFDYHNSDAGVYIKYQFNGITLSSDVKLLTSDGIYLGFFESPIPSSNCPVNSLSGDFKVAHLVTIPVFFNVD